MTHNITVGWLYPDLMSTYGDRGNIICLTRRCEWRGIAVNIVPIDQTTKDTSTSLSASQRLKAIDLLFGGGAQDREQEIVMRDLQKKKKIIRELIDKNIPALFVCGAPQLMGKYYEPAVGKRIEGLGIFDMVSKHPGPTAHRLIGNIVAEVQWQNLESPDSSVTSHPHENEDPDSRFRENDGIIVGFENHGGRTYLGKNAKPFAKVLKGYGNNGEDETEGVVYKNAIGCYFHGPLLPKNPHIADWFIQTALHVKYNEKIELKPLDDALEWKAHQAIAKRLGIGI